jgi:hypothetical protein
MKTKNENIVKVVYAVAVTSTVLAALYTNYGVFSAVLVFEILSWNQHGCGILGIFH